MLANLLVVIRFPDKKLDKTFKESVCRYACLNEIRNEKNIDEVTIEELDLLIEETLSKLDKPFILDGFPRTINQAKNLSILFDKLNISNYIVIYLNIDKELALKRTLGRVTCDKCGRSYNIFFDDFNYFFYVFYAFVHYKSTTLGYSFAITSNFY